MSRPMTSCGTYDNVTEVFFFDFFITDVSVRKPAPFAVLHYCIVVLSRRVRNSGYTVIIDVTYYPKELYALHTT